MHARDSWKRFSLSVIAVAGSFLLNAMAQVPDTSTNSPHQTLADKVAAEDLVDDKSAAAKLKREEAERKQQEDDMKYWTNDLDPLPSGGWAFRHYADDWAWALYTSSHQRKRVGDVVTIWLRWEHRDAQVSGVGMIRYHSYVEKDEFDCAGARIRIIAQTFYAERNLKGEPHSLDLNSKSAQWEAIIPGSQGEYNLQIACGTVR
jgi:hypothetical protein